MEQFIIDTDAVLARNACNVLIFRKVGLHVRVQELVRDHTSNTFLLLHPGLVSGSTLGSGGLR